MKKEMLTTYMPVFLAEEAMKKQLMKKYNDREI